jgi:hypothetical protein
MKTDPDPGVREEAEAALETKINPARPRIIASR